MSMAFPAILSNFFQKKWTPNHPQYLSGLSRALYATTFLKIAVNKITAETTTRLKMKNLPTLRVDSSLVVQFNKS